MTVEAEIKVIDVGSHHKREETSKKNLSPPEPLEGTSPADTLILAPLLTHFGHLAFWNYKRINDCCFMLLNLFLNFFIFNFFWRWYLILPPRLECSSAIRSYCSLELMASRDTLTLANQSTGITGVVHNCARPNFFKFKYYIHQRLKKISGFHSMISY